mmetsp:Transcript_21470/g.69106  ORF Transcript_21470/g.69106 Transcript_21470/m.69106 type:complete len:211 (-) Transcript_21470:594-1226(-)
MGHPLAVFARPRLFIKADRTRLRLPLRLPLLVRLGPLGRALRRKLGDLPRPHPRPLLLHRRGPLLVRKHLSLTGLSPPLEARGTAISLLGLRRRRRRRLLFLVVLPPGNNEQTPRANRQVLHRRTISETLAPHGLRRSRKNRPRPERRLARRSGLRRRGGPKTQPVRRRGEFDILERTTPRRRRHRPRGIRRLGQIHRRLRRRLILNNSE